jgi:ABC-type sugar transport system ATPase subunit
VLDTFDRPPFAAGIALKLPVIAERAAELIDEFDVRTTSAATPAGTLSGGNQQKVVLAKWLGRGPALLIVDEPTRGIDVATKAEVHHLLAGLAKSGVGVLMISSELPEVLGVSDRILVMREGALVAEFSHDEASEEAIMSAAMGQQVAK